MITEEDVLSVTCPDCMAHEGEDCRFANPEFVGSVHANRRDRYRWRSAEYGTCALCHQRMRRAHDPDDAWHPKGDDMRPCPVEPDRDDFQGWARFIAAGLQPGRPGLEHFVPNTIQGPTGQPAVDLAEQGRRLASERDDLIAQGVDPTELAVPIHPEVRLPSTVDPSIGEGLTDG